MDAFVKSETAAAAESSRPASGNLRQKGNK